VHMMSPADESVKRADEWQKLQWGADGSYR